MNWNFLGMIFLSGGLGAVSRVAISLWTAWPSLGVNIIGSFLIGLSLAFSEQRLGPDTNNIYQIFAWGFLGAFTTFSAFSLELLKIFQSGNLFRATNYALLCVSLGLLAVFLGYSFKKIL